MQAKVFGSIIRELRELRGITQLQLAAQLNVSRSTITNWEQPPAPHPVQPGRKERTAPGIVPAEWRVLFSSDEPHSVLLVSFYFSSFWSRFVCPEDQ